MAEFVEINDQNFQSQVTDAALPVILEFGATWCGPCKMLEPLLKQLGDEWAGKVQLAHIDVDENVDLTMKFNVLGVPTVILFVNGKSVERFSGYMDRNRVIARLSPHLSA
jgi:thioredoxin 1